MLKNTVRPALEAAKKAGEESVRSGASQTRCFSASASRQRVVNFPRAANPGLNQTLKEVQKKIVLPAQLPLHKRKKIFRGRWKEKLDQEPIEVEIDDLKIRFKHLDGCKGDIPNYKVMLWKAMSQMEAKKDWQVLPHLMKALSHARKLKPQTWIGMMKRAGEAGNLGPIFELATAPANDGLRLDSHEKAQTFLTGIVREAAVAKWTESATRQALRNAEKVMTLLDDKEHKPHRGPWQELSSDPQLLAVPMTMAAVLVARYKRKEHVADLDKYARAVLRKWPQGKGLLSMYPDAEYVKDGALFYMMQESKLLTVAAPILKGFQLAEQALPGDVAAQIAPRRAAVAEEIESAQARLRELQEKGKIEQVELTSGGKMYNLCFPPPEAAPKETATT